MPFRLGPMEMLVILIVFLIVLGIFVALLRVARMFLVSPSNDSDRHNKFAALRELSLQLIALQNDATLPAETKKREIQLIQREIAHLESQLYKN